MRPVLALSVALLAVAMMVCFTGLFLAGAYTFNNYIESRRDLERKEQSEKIIQAMSQVAEKIPEFRLLNRKKGNDSSANHRGTRRVFGR
jgi:hypothetical protein